MSSQVWAWSPRLSLQHPEIDATHQEFVTLCAALSDKESSILYLERLDALIEHSIAHFEQENTWMRDLSFPPAGCHQREHDTVLELMQEVRRLIENGEIDLEERLATELPLWFEHHVETMDNMLAQFMRSLEAEFTTETAAETI
jgi:hemerythrin